MPILPVGGCPGCLICPITPYSVNFVNSVMPNAQMLNMLNMLNTPNTPMDSGWTGPSLYLGREIGWWASKLAVLAGWLVGWLAPKKRKKKKNRDHHPDAVFLSPFFSWSWVRLPPTYVYIFSAWVPPWRRRRGKARPSVALAQFGYVEYSMYVCICMYVYMYGAYYT